MWPNPQFSANLITFAEEILNGELQFLCSAIYKTEELLENNLGSGNMLVSHEIHYKLFL